jgi:hypothetical protein
LLGTKNVFNLHNKFEKLNQMITLSLIIVIPLYTIFEQIFSLMNDSNTK